MSAHVLALSDERRDTLRGTVLLSLILHAVLFAVLVTYTMLGFHLGGVGR
jgi:membrane protein involved in colicin uptake